jgi:hypothetical protein
LGARIAKDTPLQSFLRLIRIVLTFIIRLLLVKKCHVNFFDLGDDDDKLDTVTDPSVL